MKRTIIIMLLCMVGLSSSAQYYHVSHYGKLYRDDEKIGYEDARVLFSDVFGMDMSADWDKADNGYHGARIVQLVGSLCTKACIVGLYFTDGHNFDNVLHPDRGISKKSYALLLGAFAGCITETFAWQRASDCLEEMRLMARWLNQQEAGGSGAQLKVGPTASGGFGIALNF